MSSLTGPRSGISHARATFARLLSIASDSRPAGVFALAPPVSVASAGLLVVAAAAPSGFVGAVPARPAKYATIAARSVSAGTRMRSLESSPRPSGFGGSTRPGHAMPCDRLAGGVAVESTAREDTTGAGSITVAAGGGGGGGGGAGACSMVAEIPSDPAIAASLGAGAGASDPTR